MCVNISRMLLEDWDGFCFFWQRCYLLLPSNNRNDRIRGCCLRCAHALRLKRIAWAPRGRCAHALRLKRIAWAVSDHHRADVYHYPKLRPVGNPHRLWSEFFWRIKPWWQGNCCFLNLGDVMPETTEKVIRKLCSCHKWFLMLSSLWRIRSLDLTKVPFESTEVLWKKGWLTSNTTEEYRGRECILHHSHRPRFHHQ